METLNGELTPLPQILASPVIRRYLSSRHRKQFLISLRHWPKFKADIKRLLKVK